MLLFFMYLVSIITAIITIFIILNVLINNRNKLSDSLDQWKIDFIHQEFTEKQEEINKITNDIKILENKLENLKYEKLVLTNRLNSLEANWKKRQLQLKSNHDKRIYDLKIKHMNISRRNTINKLFSDIAESLEKDSKIQQYFE